MGTKLFGIGAAENSDNIQETLSIKGLEDRVKFIRDEHEDLSMFRVLGSIDKTRKIFAEQDCEDDKQRRCWNFTKVPFLYFEGTLADDTDHPNAKAAAELLKFTNAHQTPLQIGASIDGGIIERLTPEGQVTEDKEVGKFLNKTVGLSLALTVKPANPKCRVFLENDLQKSAWAGPPPAIYFEALKKSQAATSFNEMTAFELQLYMKVTKLKKSLQDFFSAFTDVKCQQCGRGVRFFKSSNSVPNGCPECGHQFSLTQIWKALNK